MKKTIYIALFTAFIIVLGYIPPIVLTFIPVPIVFQNMGPLLAGSVLGAYGFLSIVLLFVLTVLGLPVLAGGRGGIAIFFGPSGGYLLGYIVAALVVGILIQKNWYSLNLLQAVIINIMGVLLIYLCGIPILTFVTKMELSKAIISNLAFIPLDIVKAIMSATIAMQFKRFYPLIKMKYLD